MTGSHECMHLNPRRASQLRRLLPLDLEDLQLKLQVAVRRDPPGREAPRAVALICGDPQHPDLADAHASRAHVPALDHTTSSSVGERLLPRVLRAPELLLRFGDSPCGMHSYGLSNRNDRRIRWPLLGDIIRRLDT